MVYLKKKVALVIILGFILSFSVAVIIPYIPLYGEEIGLSVSVIGYIVATYHLIQFFGRIPMGSFSDIFGYGKIIAFGTLSLFLGMIFYNLTPSLWPLLFLAQIMIGIAICMTWVTLPSFVTRFGPEKVPMFTFVVGWAYAFSVPLGGVLKDFFGMSSIFLLGGLLSFPALFIAFLIFKDGESQEKDTENREKDLSITSMYKDAFETLKSRKVLRASLYSFLMFMNFNIALSLVPLYLSGLGFSASFIGAFHFARMGTGSSIRLFVKRVQSRINKKLILIATTMFSGVVLIILSRLESQWAIISLAVIWGLVSGLYHPVVFELIADGTMDEDRGKGMGIRGTLGTIGSFTGIVIFSNLAEIWSVRTSIFLSGMSVVIGVILIEVWIQTELGFSRS